MPKKLVLRREALAELSPADLRHVVAGEAPTYVACQTGISYCKVCDNFPTAEGCTPTPDA